MSSGAWSRDGHRGRARATAAATLTSHCRWLCQLGWRCHMQGPGLWLGFFGNHSVPLAFD